MINRRWAIIFLTALAALAIVVSLIQAGLPKQVRRQQYDEQKVADLQRLQQAITDYAYVQWRLSSSSTAKLLPPRLTDLQNLNFDQLFLTDPLTGQAYGYQVVDDSHYQLCAEFLTAVTGPAAPAAPAAAMNWDHPAGRYCFTQTLNFDQLKLDRGNYPMPLPVPVRAVD